MERLLLAAAGLLEPLGALLVAAAALAAAIGGPFVAKRFPSRGEGKEAVVELLSRLALVSLLGGGMVAAGAALRLRVEESMPTWRWLLVAAITGGALGGTTLLGGGGRDGEGATDAGRFRRIAAGALLLALAGALAAGFLVIGR